MDSHPSPSDDPSIRRSLSPLPRHFSGPIRRVGMVLRSSLGFGRMLGSGLGARDMASSPGGLDTVRVPEGAWHLPRHEDVQTGPVDTQMAALRAAMTKNRPARVVEPARRGVPIVARRMGRTMKGESVGPSGLTRQIRPAESAIPRNESHGVDRAAQGQVAPEDPMEALRRGMQARRDGSAPQQPPPPASTGTPSQRRPGSREGSVDRSATQSTVTPRSGRTPGRPSPRARSGPRPPRSASDGESSSGARAALEPRSPDPVPSDPVSRRSPARAVDVSRSLPRRALKPVPIAGRRRQHVASVGTESPVSRRAVESREREPGLGAPTGSMRSTTASAPGVRAHQVAPAGVARRSLAYSVVSAAGSRSSRSELQTAGSAAQPSPGSDDHTSVLADRSRPLAERVAALAARDGGVEQPVSPRVGTDAPPVLTRSSVYRSASRSAVNRLAPTAASVDGLAPRVRDGAPTPTPTGHSLRRLTRNTTRSDPHAAGTVGGAVAPGRSSGVVGSSGAISDGAGVSAMSPATTGVSRSASEKPQESHVPSNLASDATSRPASRVVPEAASETIVASDLAARSPERIARIASAGVPSVMVPSEPVAPRASVAAPVSGAPVATLSRLASSVASGFIRSGPPSSLSSAPAASVVRSAPPVAAPLIGETVRARVTTSAGSSVRRRVTERVAASQPTRALARHVVSPRALATTPVASANESQTRLPSVTEEPRTGAYASRLGSGATQTLGAAAVPMPETVSRRALPSAVLDRRARASQTPAPAAATATTATGEVVSAAVMDRSLPLAERVAALASGPANATAHSTTVASVNRRITPSRSDSGTVVEQSSEASQRDAGRPLSPSAMMSLPIAGRAIAGRAIVSRRVEAHRATSAARDERGSAAVLASSVSASTPTVHRSNRVGATEGSDGSSTPPLNASPEVSSLPVSPGGRIARRSAVGEAVAHGARQRDAPDASIHRRHEGTASGIRDVPARRVSIRPPRHVMRMMAGDGIGPVTIGDKTLFEAEKRSRQDIYARSSGAAAPGFGSLPDFGVRFVPGAPMPMQNLLTTGTVSNGDEAGAELGVASGMILGPDKPVLGSSKVFASAVARRAMRPVRHSNDARTTVMRSALPEHSRHGVSSAAVAAGSAGAPPASPTSRPDVPPAVLDRSRPLAERVAALAGRGPAARPSSASVQSSTVAPVTAATMPVRPAVSAIAGGHAGGVDRSTVSRRQASGGATSTSTRLIRSARSDQVVPAPLPAPRMPTITPSLAPTSPTAGSPASTTTGSAGVSRSSQATVRGASGSSSSTVSRSSSTPSVSRSRDDGQVGDGGTDSPIVNKGRVVRSQTAIQRRALRPSTSNSTVVSRASTPTNNAPVRSGSGPADRFEMTEQLLEALEERILRALERRGGIQRGWF